MQIIEQVNITMPNVPSSLAKVGDKLRAAEVNIEAVSCTEGPSQTMIHLIVSDAETAKIVLKGLGPVTVSQVIAIKVRNKPGAIADIGRACAAMGINIRLIYSTAWGKEGIVYLGVEGEPAQAIELMKKWEKSAGGKQS